MTIYIHFHQSRYRDFKHYYLLHVHKHLSHFFPHLVSYPRFVTRIKSVLIPWCFFLQTLKREKQHRVFKGLAQKGKSTMDWFFGFKLH